MSELTLVELLNSGELVDVRMLSFNAETLAEPRPDYEAGEAQHKVQVEVGTAPNVIEVRLNVTVSSASADYKVVAATQFRYSSEGTVTEELAAEFAEAVGIAAVYPYIREAVQSFSTRLRDGSITMPLWRSAQLTKED